MSESEITDCNVDNMKEESTWVGDGLNVSTEDVNVFDPNRVNDHIKVEFYVQEGDVEKDEDIKDDIVMKCEAEDEVLTRPVVEQPTLVRNGKSCVLSFSRLYIFDIWHSKRGTETEKRLHIIGLMTNSIFNLENYNTQHLEKKLAYLNRKFVEKSRKHMHNRKRMLKAQSAWLNVTERFELQRNDRKKTAKGKRKNVIRRISPSPPKEKPNPRPLKSFEECCNRTQRRRTAILSKVDESTITALVKASKRPAMQNLEPSEALSLMKEANLTKRQYFSMRKFFNDKFSSNILPSYYNVISTKKKCCLET